MNKPCFYRVSVKGVVVDQDGRVLLAREKDGWWDMLGGGLEHDEDPRAGLTREVLEETGLTVASISDRPLYFITGANATGEVAVANVIYQIELDSLDLTPSDECQELRFVNADEMRELKILPIVRKLADQLEQSR